MTWRFEPRMERTARGTHTPESRTVLFVDPCSFIEIGGRKRPGYVIRTEGRATMDDGYGTKDLGYGRTDLGRRTKDLGLRS
jgi:hypothetical protein